MTINQLAAQTGISSHILSFVIETARRQMKRGMSAGAAITVAIGDLNTITEQLYSNRRHFGNREGFDRTFGDGMFAALADNLYDSLRAKEAA